MLTIMLVAIAATAAIAAWLLTRDTIKPRDVAIAGVLTVWVAGVGIKIWSDRATEAEDAALVAETFRLPEWATPPPADASSSALPEENRALTAAPVPDLIGGLETRLASEPNDAKGWALLAQSYAFVGDTAGAERAFARAIALGFDAQALRARMRSAERPAEAHSWIDRTIGR
jgi:hypothetical protein